MSKPYKYAIIRPSEDGDPVCYLSDDELEDINDLMDGYSIKEWVEDYSDPNYWEEGNGMLVKIQCINPIPVKEVTAWKIQD